MVRKIKEKYKVAITIITIAILLGFISIYLYAFDREEINNNETTEENSVNTVVNSDEEIQDETKMPKEDNVLIAFLSSTEESNEWTEIKHINEINRQTYTNQEGIEYYVDATLSIPKISLNYPVLSKCSNKLLEHNLNKFWGCEPNEVGNYVIAGHNYNNKTYFGKLSELAIGDLIYLTDVKDRTLTYQIYDMYYVNPTDVECTSQLTDGKKEVTLITCNATGSQRLVVKATQI